MLSFSSEYLRAFSGADAEMCFSRMDDLKKGQNVTLNTDSNHNLYLCLAPGTSTGFDAGGGPNKPITDGLSSFLPTCDVIVFCSSTF